MTSVIFMGTPAFSAPILERLLKEGYDVLAVVTQPDRPVGRKHRLTPSPVKEVALAHHLKVLQPEKLSGSPEADQIIALKPDLLITAAFGQFLPTSVLAAAQKWALNVHASLLPKYRGGAPIQYAILNGDAETGVTIMEMVKKMDAGDILAQQTLAIAPTDDNGTLFDRLSKVGEELLIATLPRLLAGEITPTPQDPAQVTFSANIKPDEEVIDLNTTATEIDQKVRALRPLPGAYVKHQGQRVKLWAVTPVSETTTATPGTIVARGKHELQVAAGAGTVFAIDELQPAGKAKMTITAYLNGMGHDLKEGQLLFDGQ